MGVRNGLPEDVTQSVNSSWSTEATKEQRVRKFKHITSPGNGLYSTWAVGTALNGPVGNVQEALGRVWVQDEAREPAEEPLRVLYILLRHLYLYSDNTVGAELSLKDSCSGSLERRLVWRTPEAGDFCRLSPRMQSNRLNARSVTLIQLNSCWKTYPFTNSLKKYFCLSLLTMYLLPNKRMWDLSYL